jgi:aspartate racemase
MYSQTIGILGGLGPEATQLLFKHIIERTPAKSDQEHIQTMIYNNPKIPDRTQAILYNGKSPVGELVRGARTLEISGADMIIIPCNTAHYFVNEVQKSVSIPIINMIKETAKRIKSKYPEIKRIGLLATTGTVATKIYHQELAKYNIEVITPSETIQENIVMDAIYGQKGIKAGFHRKPKQQLEIAGEKLIKKGAELIIAGCTEISIVLKQKSVNYCVVDPLVILAETAIEQVLIPNIAKVINQERPEFVQKTVCLEVIEEEE